MDGVQAWVQLQRFVKGPESLGILGGFKVPEPDGTVLLQLCHDLLSLGKKPLFLRSLLQLIPELSGIDDEGSSLLDRRQLLDVNVISIPDGGRAVGQSTGQVGGLALSHCRLAGSLLAAGHASPFSVLGCLDHAESPNQSCSDANGVCSWGRRCAGSCRRCRGCRASAQGWAAGGVGRGADKGRSTCHGSSSGNHASNGQASFGAHDDAAAVMENCPAALKKP